MNVNVSLVITQDKAYIKSNELVDIINSFRLVEAEALGEKYIELRHDSLMAKIETEITGMKKLGISLQNFLVSTYINSRGKEYPCYLLNRDSMLQMLMSESIFVRAKTIEYINKLEEDNKKNKIPQTYAEALRAYADEVEESERLKAENEKQQLLLAEQQPKVEAYNTAMSTDGLLSFKQVADIIAIKGLGRNKLMEFLRSRGILLDRLNKNRPAGKYVDAGYFKEVIATYDNGYGKNNNTTTTYVTPEGLAFIISQVNKHYVTKSKKSNNK